MRGNSVYLEHRATTSAPALPTLEQRKKKKKWGSLKRGKNKKTNSGAQVRQVLSTRPEKRKLRCHSFSFIHPPSCACACVLFFAEWATGVNRLIVNRLIVRDPYARTEVHNCRVASATPERESIEREVMSEASQQVSHLQKIHMISSVGPVIDDPFEDTNKPHSCASREWFEAPCMRGFIVELVEVVWKGPMRLAKEIAL